MKHRRLPVPRPLELAATLAVLAAHPARADDAPVAFDPVTVRANAERPRLTVGRVDTAATRPQSVVTQPAIETIASPVADFGNLANLTPSFVSSAPNGNGFDAAKNMTLRGFPDGQFNVTVDGIPFADPDGFAHHSTSIFPASSIEQLAVDRSPGSGTTLGYATIGGTVGIESLALPQTAGVRLYGSYGSFATSLVGVRAATARPVADGDTGVMVNLQHMRSNGAMTNAEGERSDILLKAESRFAGVQATALYAYDIYHFDNPPSVSTAQIGQYGANFGFSDTPGTPTYAGYGKTGRHADFGYLRLRAPLAGGWSAVETLYTYAYGNTGLSLKGDSTASPVGTGFGVPATDIAGRTTSVNYRTFGNTLQLEHTDAAGVLRTGLWLEHSRQHANRNALDLSTGVPYNLNKAAATSSLYDWDSTLATVQPFVDYEWRALPRLTLKGGLRWQRVTRSFDAGVVPTSLPSTNGTALRRVTSTLPNLEANYAFTESTHAYVEWAKGALVPNQSFFYTSAPAQGNQARPQTAQALQTGVVHATGPVDVTVDAYLIDLKDYVSTVVLNNTTTYQNVGKVRYRGVEAEGHADLGAGFTAIANASLIRAQFRTAGAANAAQQAGDSLSLVPTYTGVAGFTYARGPWTGSLVTKFVGPEFQGKNGSSDGPNFRVDHYNYTDLSIGRSLDDLLPLRRSSLVLQVANLGNQRSVTDTGGPSAAGPLLVNVLARRSVSLTLRCEL